MLTVPLVSRRQLTAVELSTVQVPTLVPLLCFTKAKDDPTLFLKAASLSARVLRRQSLS
ncbi:hypothetical protein [Streptomyces syringium]|uniref:hypothetical protein n=1 Tax=Streptomyces syringium TaxID=76729 RepID=UPI003400C7D2